MGDLPSKIIEYFTFNPNGYDSTFMNEEYKGIINDYHYRSVYHKGLNMETEYWIYDPKEYFFKKKALSENKSKSKEINVVFDSKNGINVLLVFHGNAETCLHSLSYLQPLIHDLYKTYMIVLVEYPHYGFLLKEDLRRPTEKETLEMSLTVYKDVMRLMSDNDLPLRSVNILGRSLGTGVGIWLSTRIKHMKKMLLIHPFRSIAEVSKIRLPKCIMDIIHKRYNIFKSFENIKYTNAKEVCFVHARNDYFIPYTHSVSLYEELIKQNKYAVLYIVPDGEHGCSFIVCPKVLNAISTEKNKKKRYVKEKAQCFDLPGHWPKYVGDEVDSNDVTVSVFNEIKQFMLRI